MEVVVSVNPTSVSVAAIVCVGIAVALGYLWLVRSDLVSLLQSAEVAYLRLEQHAALGAPIGAAALAYDACAIGYENERARIPGRWVVAGLPHLCSANEILAGWEEGGYVG